MNGEARLLAPLLAWLRRTRRVNGQTQIAYELVWFGRRVDVATLSISRRASAYELKIGGLGRALEQASYNRLAFDRSYVVTNSMPREANLTSYGRGARYRRDRHSAGQRQAASRVSSSTR